ncbi:MAG: hypothetical protein HZB39_08395 [Planctomycetes bacterium]|nr:hypothetical protein [Planctomycetota bacterium]
MNVLRSNHEEQSGFAAITMLIVMLPVLWFVGVHLSAMTARNERLGSEIDEERALMGCESGFDVIQFVAREGGLHHGLVVEDILPGGTSFVARAEYLGSDGLSNDGDIDVDEPDEDVFRIIVDGRNGEARRRIAAYLGFTTSMPRPGAAVSATEPLGDIRITGTAFIDGRNHDVNRVLVGSGDTYGISILPPGSPADLLSRLTAAEQLRVNGLGGPPSVGLSTATIDVPALVAELRNAAQIVITNGNVAGVTWGNASAGPHYIVFRDGDLRITGNSTGSGVLVVTGELTITGRLAWNGIVLVLRDFAGSAGTASINGALVLGPDANTLDVRGTIDLTYSAQAVETARRLTGRYVAYNGWQEISTR